MIKVVDTRHVSFLVLKNTAVSCYWKVRPQIPLQRQKNLPRCSANGLHVEHAQASRSPLRKELEDEARRKREAPPAKSSPEQEARRGKNEDSRAGKWRLTVGLEIHAQLSTQCKLFSAANAAHHNGPNSSVAPFDLAFPGTQPAFQQEILLPAIRAALALSCNIRRVSRFDRKHYYYQDQPAGYQITQFYEPFAAEGQVSVDEDDGIAPEDGLWIDIDISQVQLEQDTAKSTLQPPNTALLDFNRVGHPLIEIITRPQIHHPQTAAACARKIQAILQDVNANTTGMELGGLRADVNVSVSPNDSHALGQRTEIKNLSSFKAIEDAIVAERDRQIAVLESGGIIDGETRGWTIGSTETTKLRGKEGEVDYRYMPDPDIPPLIITKDLVDYIADSLPPVSETIIDNLMVESGLTFKDAKTLVALDDGDRLDYFDEVKPLYREHTKKLKEQSKYPDKIVANWVLHELGGLLSSSNNVFSPDLVPAKSMAEILSYLSKAKVTGTSAKRLLARVFHGDKRSIKTIIKAESLGLKLMAEDEYVSMAQGIIRDNEEKVKQIQQLKQKGKLQYLVGQMMRQGGGRVEGAKAEDILRELLGVD